MLSDAEIQFRSSTVWCDGQSDGIFPFEFEYDPLDGCCVKVRYHARFEGMCARLYTTCFDFIDQDLSQSGGILGIESIPITGGQNRFCFEAAGSHFMIRVFDCLDNPASTDPCDCNNMTEVACADFPNYGDCEISDECN